MKSFALYRRYIDCPTCDGTGDLEFKIFTTIQDLLMFIQKNVDQLEVEHVFDEQEEISFEVNIKKSFHRIHEVEITQLKNDKKKWNITRPHGKWEIEEV